MNNFFLNFIESMASMAARPPDIDNLQHLMEQLSGERWQRVPRGGTRHSSDTTRFNQDDMAQNSLDQCKNEIFLFCLYDSMLNIVVQRL